MLESLKSLRTVRYPYDEISDRQRAQDLLNVAWGTVAATFGGLILQLTSRSRRPFFHVFDYPVGKNQIACLLLCLAGIAGLIIIARQVNRGELGKASTIFTVNLFIIAFLVYIPNQLNSFFMITFTLPVTAAGVLLNRRGVLVTVGAVIATLVILVGLDQVGLLTNIATGVPTPVEIIVYGGLLFFIDSLVLSIFAGGQRILLEKNLALTRQHEAAAAAIEKANRAYRVLSESNQAVVHATDEAALLQQVCDIVVETGRYRLAWVGFTEKDAEKTIHLAAYAGEAGGILKATPMTWGNTNNPTAMAIRTRAAYAAQHIPTDPTYATWRSAALASGFKSSLALPLRAGAQILGALNIYAGEAQAFNREEIDLLAQLANDLAYGIIALRERSVRAEVEAAHLRLQQEIIEAQQNAIRRLSTPIIPIMEGTIIVPLIGDIDSARARDITRTVLAGVGEHQATTVILDITGVPLIDSGVADHLNKTIQAAKLKGTRILITGMTPEVAEAVVDLGINWHELETLRSLQTGLRRVIREAHIEGQAGL
ncbi:MAG: GAF domain-containing protein [Anaerolineae bacterium]|nr:GAF domain-containing protein [Anaerolineae bacterium]